MCQYNARGLLRSLGATLKNFLYILIALFITSCQSETIEKPLVVDYYFFGPQAASFEIIGFGWYQWNTQGPDKGEPEDIIKVVIYKETSLEKIKKNYPVNTTIEQDYRYIKYQTAISHFNKLIPEFNEAKINNEQLIKNLSLIVSHFK